MSATIKFPPVPHAPANLTPDELVQHIEFHYPNLAGPLGVLLERFTSSKYDNRYNDVTEQAAPARESCCPHCGTKFEVLP